MRGVVYGACLSDFVIFLEVKEIVGYVVVGR